MAGLISITRDGKKNMSIGELDRLMDEAIGINAGKMTPIQAAVVPVAYKAIRKISGAVSRMPYYIENEQEADVTEDNTPRYWKTLNSKIASSLLKWGAAYCLKETNQYGLNTRWRFLPAPFVRYHLDGNDEIDYFEYSNGGKVDRIYDFNKRLLWWWWPNDESEIGPGAWPLYSAMRDIGLADNLTMFAESYFARGGFPLTILSTEGNISEPEKVLSWWNAMIRGARQAFRAILLTNKITPTVIGTPMNETISPELYDQAIRNVGLAFDIPITLLMSDAANYATSLQDHIEFYTDNVIPMTDLIFEVWNERVYNPIGLNIETDPSQLEIMQAYQLETAAAVVAVVGKPVLTVDEGREILGYDPMGDDALDEPQEAQPVAEQPATPEPVTAQPDESQDDAIETERKALRRYAHNRLRDGKPFAFRSDVIGLPEIDAVKAMTTHDAIDALDLSNVKRGPELAELIDAINAARAELKAVANG